MHALYLPLSQYLTTWTMRSPQQVPLVCYEIMKVLMKIVTLHPLQDVDDFCSKFTDNFFRIGRELTNLALLNFDKILEIFGYSIEYYE